MGELWKNYGWNYLRNDCELIRLSEVYIISYLKNIIKNSQMSNQSKFRSLLLLKDLMSHNCEKLQSYVVQKILHRLFLLATHKLREKCLMLYNPVSNLEYSCKFYELILFCLKQWHESYGTNYPLFTSYYESLSYD